MSVGRQELLIQELELELLVLSEGERQLTNDYLTNGYKSEIVRGACLIRRCLTRKRLKSTWRRLLTLISKALNGRSVSGRGRSSCANW